MNQPPLQIPLSYYPQPPKRLIGVMIFGWLAIIFGGLGTLSPLCIMAAKMLPQPSVNVMESTKFLKIYNDIALIVGWPVSVALLTGGIQALQLRPMGRKLLIGYAWYLIATAIVGTFISIFAIWPQMQLMYQRQGIPNPQAAKIGFVIGFGLTIIFQIGIAVGGMIYFKQKRVVEEFESRGRNLTLPPLNSWPISSPPPPPDHTPPNP